MWAQEQEIENINIEDTNNEKKSNLSMGMGQ
jgi:hypothetical protein